MGNLANNEILNASISPSFLAKENYLSEYSELDDKSKVRANLQVYSVKEIDDKLQTISFNKDEIESIINKYISSLNLGDLEQLRRDIAEANFIRANGSVPFTGPQSQSKEPTKPDHLANKAYVDRVIINHNSSYDAHNIREKISDALVDYAKKETVYNKEDLYTSKEVDSIVAQFVKQDGTVPFYRPQPGIDPMVPQHLATMRYVLSIMEKHNQETDPHGYHKYLNATLKNYYTKSETYTKAQTFSRNQLYDIIQDKMNDAIDQKIAENNANNGSAAELEKFVLDELTKYVKRDGSVKIQNPQKGESAQEDDEFIVKKQLDKSLSTLNKDINEKLERSTNQTTWLTSGPVEATVGLVNIGTELPREMTVQQIMDTIFYGAGNNIIAPPYAMYGEKVCITVTAHGLSTLVQVDLYKNNVFIGTLYPEDFKAAEQDPDNLGLAYEFCETGEFTEDTEWKAKFIYSDGKTLTAMAKTKLAYPMFIGMIPYWWNVQEDVTMESLKKLAEEDPKNMYMITEEGPEINEIILPFNYVDAKKRSLLIVMPAEYPSLQYINTQSQQLGSDAFAKWIQPMYPNVTTQGVLYNLYVYNIPLVKLDQRIMFKFGKD